MEKLMMDENNSAYNNVTYYSFNESDIGGPVFVHPFSYTHIKVIFIILYSIVFAACFLGNIGILILIIKNKSLRTKTNFFLANLAIADFCVGNFCVLPNLSTFLSPVWVLGKTMCKLYYFVQGMSYTASILLLTAIAIERYIAIIHPLRSRHLFTLVRLQIAQVCIWLMACCYNIPYLLVFDTVDIVTAKGKEISFCFVSLSFQEMQTLSTVNFVLWYIIPLFGMAIMYTQISVTLWKSSAPSSDIRSACAFYKKSKTLRSKRFNNLMCVKIKEKCDETEEAYQHNIRFEICSGDTSSFGSHLDTVPRINTRDKYSQETLTSSLRYEISDDTSDEAICPINMEQKGESSELRSLRHSISDIGSSALTDISGDTMSTTTYSNRLTVPRIRTVRVASRSGLNARRKVIRLLLILLLTFAVCVLPNHLRIILHYWTIYPPASGDIGLFPPISFLLLYLNSALNPVLYWFFSESFRRSLLETCSCKRKR